MEFNGGLYKYYMKKRMASLNAKFFRALDNLIRYPSIPYPDNEFRVVWTTRDRPVLNDLLGDLHTLDWIRLHSLYWVGERINSLSLRGSVAELGVYKGSFARHINYLFSSRKIFLFDTFEGFPEESLKSDFNKGYTARELSVDSIRFADTHIDHIMNQMPNPENVIIKKGLFPETTKGLENENYCFVSLDCDLYQPILDGLSYFYPRLVEGGYIFLHDYANPSYKGVHAAFSEFEEKNRDLLVFPLFDAHGTLVITKGLSSL